MVRDRGYEVGRSSAYAPDKADAEWVIRGTHPSRLAGDRNEQLHVFFLRDARQQLRTLQDVLEQHRGSRVLAVLFENSAGGYGVRAAARKCRELRADAELFEARRLVFNVTRHALVPKHVVLDEAQKRDVLARFHAREADLQTISIWDPVAKYYGMREGQVVMVVRVSENTGCFVNFRICVDSGDDEWKA